MADELAQVVQMEIEGVKIAFNASLQVAAFMMRALKAILQGGKNTVGGISDMRLKSPGEKSIKQLMKLAGDKPVNVNSINKKDLEEFKKLAEKNGLHFAIMIDPNPYDELIPIAFLPNEVSLMRGLLDSIERKRTKIDKEVAAGYQSQIDEVKEQLLQCKDPDEKKSLETKLENLEHAKSEAEELVKADKDLSEKNSKPGSLQDYLMELKGTDFEKNPEIAMAEYEKGVEIGKKINAKECFQPIRCKSLVPESELMFYVPEIGAVVTRKFEIDKDTSLVYSNFSFKTKEGEIINFTDKNVTTEDWNNTHLPKLFDKAGILEETKCRAFDTEEKFKNYQTYHNKVENPSKEKIQIAMQEGKEVFSTAEAKSEAVTFVSEQSKGFASAPVSGTTVEITCPFESLKRENGKLQLALSEDESIVFSGIQNEGMKNGQAVFSIDDKSDISFVKKSGRAITGINISPEEAKSKIKETLGENVAQTITSIKHNSR